MEAIGDCLINVKGCTINCSINIVTVLLEYFKHILNVYYIKIHFWRGSALLRGL